MNIQGKHYRTIWLHPNDERVVQIIDQRHLPHRFVIEDLTMLEDFEVAIRDMHVRGRTAHRRSGGLRHVCGGCAVYGFAIFCFATCGFAKF